MDDLLTIEQAATLAQDLTTIPDCPRSDEAIQALAFDLMDICRSAEEARSVVREARYKWTKWLGTAGLIGLLKGRRSSESALQPVRPRCAKCGDTGTLSAEGSNAWCDCLAARSIRVGEPDLVENLNHPQPAPPLEDLEARMRLLLPGTAPGLRLVRRPMTGAEREREYAQQRAETEQAITAAREVLADPDASSERKEIAAETLRALGVTEQPASRARGRRLRSRPKIQSAPRSAVTRTGTGSTAPTRAKADEPLDLFGTRGR